jgi:Gpi18-like mannosyltransferase
MNIQIFKNSNNFLKDKMRILVYYLPILFLLIVLTPTTGHGSDYFCWIEWCKFQYQNGISNTYQSWTDYLPLYHYILNLFGKMIGNIEEIPRYIYRLKYITYLFELGSTLILFYILKNQFKDFFKSLFFSLFYLLNFAVLYNSAIWGQVDGIMTFFVFASIISAYYNKTILSILLFVLAVNMKLQAIFFLPLSFYVLVLQYERKQLVKFGIGLFCSLLLQFIIISPFYFNGDLDKFWQVIENSAGKYPKITMNAYNFWALLVDSKNFFDSDADQYWLLTYKSWGLLLFLSTSFMVLIIPLIRVYKKLIQGKSLNNSLNEILLLGAIIPLLFFFFNTQMHERYSHPAFIFITVYSLLNRKIYILVISSIAYFLNLEDVLQAFNTQNYGTLIYTPFFIALLYLLTIVLLFIELYKCQLNKNFSVKENVS